MASAVPDASFFGIVLLPTPEWQIDRFLAQYEADWGEKPMAVNLSEAEGVEGAALQFKEGVVILMHKPTPVPNGEAERAAGNNYVWRGAKAAAAAHKAHLAIGVGRPDYPEEAQHLEALPPEERSARFHASAELGTLLVKACASALAATNALGLYANDTVWEPRSYRGATALVSRGILPIPNLVWIGICVNDLGELGGWTNGLRPFGLKELELESVADMTPADLQSFLFDLVAHELEEGAIFRSGDRIAYSASEKMLLEAGPGIYRPTGETTLHIVMKRDEAEEDEMPESRGPQTEGGIHLA